jgi:hypothetical protein
MVASAHAASSYTFRICGPNGKLAREIHARTVNSGNRVTTAVISLLCVFAATDAGRVGEDGTGAMWVAPELLAAVAPAQPECGSNVVVQVTDLAAAGRVNFDWHPATGELSFDARGVMPQVDLPDDWLPDSQDLVTPIQSCGSR